MEQKINFCIAVFDKTKKNLNRYFLKEMKDLYSCSDNKLERFYPIFPLAEGLPVKITKNITIMESLMGLIEEL